MNRRQSQRCCAGKKHSNEALGNQNTIGDAHGHRRGTSMAVDQVADRDSEAEVEDSDEHYALIRRMHKIDFESASTDVLCSPSFPCLHGSDG